MEKIALILDGDGVLVKPGTQDVPEEVRTLLFFTPEFFPIVATGRPLGWGWTIGEQIHAIGVFGENGLVFQSRKGEQIEDAWSISRTLKTDAGALKEALHFEIIGGSRAKITVNEQEYPVFVELGKEEILTLGTLEVEQRETEEFLLTPQELKQMCADIIRKNKLRIGILGPYSDGHVEFLPLSDDGRLLDKRIIPGILQFRFKGKFEKLIAFIDGANDISLALHKDVFPVTFANGVDAIKQIVAARNGLIVDMPGYEGGCAEALRILRNDLLGIRSLDIQRINASVIFRGG